MWQTKLSTPFIDLDKNRNSLFKMKCTLFDVFESILYKAIKDDYGRDEESAIKLSKVVIGLIFAYRSFLYEYNFQEKINECRQELRSILNVLIKE